MESVNLVNLIQAVTVGVSSLGGLILWRKRHLRGIALLLWLTALASTVNILEETGITRDIYLISPVFIMLFGPATYLATKHLTSGRLKTADWNHLLPVIPVLFFTSQVAIVIAVGTLWRLIYVFFIMRQLVDFKSRLDNHRSDADDFSLRWLTWVVVGTAVFNLIDLIRLNSQSLITHELNKFGQGINNSVWLVATMIIVIKLVDFKLPLNRASHDVNKDSNASKEGDDASVEDYRSTFAELDALVKSQQWYLKPRITLNDLSELTGLQIRDISRAINTVSHKSFNEYINGYRVEQICQQLNCHTTQSLTRLYTDAGFSSKASFNKVFKAFTGLTPSQYKANKVQEQDSGRLKT